LRPVGLGLLLVLSACRVERTPEQYFDHQTTIEAEREAAAGELRDRLLAMGEAIDRGNATEALIALSPAADAFILGPREGMVVSGSERISALLDSLLASRTVAAEVRDVQVGIAARANVGWFRADLALPGIIPGDRPLRMTGVYVRDAGLWKLVQAHLSTTISEPETDSSSNPKAEAGDSEGGGASGSESPSPRGGT
jgi:hypothetical protein